VTARELTLSSLYAARDKLGDLIVRWTPEAGDDAARRSQAEALQGLLRARDEVSGAINGVIGIAFREVSTPELLGAARELAATAAALQAFGQSIAQVGEVLKAVDRAVELTTKVMLLAV
jgi:hypothetical protein